MKDKNRIINSILEAQGTTLCLGHRFSHFTSVLGIDDKSFEMSERVLVIYADIAEDKPLSTQWFVYGIEWRIVMLPSRGLVGRAAAYMSLDTWHKDIDKLRKDYLSETVDIAKSAEAESVVKAAIAYMSSLRVCNIRVIDGFPFMSHETVVELMNAKRLGEKAGVPVGAALVAGLYKFGSTDISTEEEAVEEACKTCGKIGVSCTVVSRKIEDSQVAELFSPASQRLSERLRQFKEECRKTKENINISKEIMGTLLMIGSNMSLLEYVRYVQGMKDVLEPMLPALKYIDMKFYDNFKNQISPIFSDRKESNIYQDSEKCAGVFCNLILKWINR